MSHPGQLATKDDILSTVWAGTAVSDASLATAIREVRRALGDCARAPRFIETVHRRGYRFIAQIAESDGPANQPGLKLLRTASETQSAFALNGIAPSHCFVGREAELTVLNEWHAAARSNLLPSAVRYEGGGYGAGMRVASGGKTAHDAAGAVSWNGAAGTMWLVDPTRRFNFVFMSQFMPPTSYPIWTEADSALDADRASN